MSTVVPEAGQGASPLQSQAARGVTTVLVVDDSSAARRAVGELLESRKDVKVAYARDGREGLAAIAHEAPSVILTDLVMPDMEGLELIQEVRIRHPHIPVILMTAFGSEEVAMRALRAGAANYIPKKDLARDLAPTLRHVLAIAGMGRERRRILGMMVRRVTTFVLDNDPELITPLLRLLQEEIDGMGICDPTGQMQVGVALQEALCNALFHGNLEVSSELRQGDRDEFDELATERRGLQPFRSRRIDVQAYLDRDGARFVVTDDGPGFDTSLFDRPVTPEDLGRIGGRGLLLIRTFMDKVSFNKTGSQISMEKYRSV
ncbi:MAG: response regulator [Isosphaerales bacterium]